MSLTYANSLFSEGLDKHLKGDINEAKSRYLRVLQDYPNHSDALHHLGIVHLQLGEFDQAIALIQRSLKALPHQTTALSNLGYCFNILSRFHESIEVCKKAVAIDPLNDGAWTNLGNAQKALDLTDDAKDSYQNALAIQPKNPRYIYNLAINYYNKKNHIKASNLFKECLDIDNSIPEAHNNLAVCFLESKNPNSALKHADFAIKLNPEYVEAWNNRGNALCDLRKHEAAIASYERSIELKPQYAEAWNNRGNALRVLRRYEEALSSYDKSIELSPDYPEAWTNRGNALYNLQRYEEALYSHDRSIELNPDYAEAWSNRGNALCSLQRYEEGLASHEQSIKLKPENAQAWGDRGNALCDLHHYREALASYDRSIDLELDYAESYYNKSVLQLKQYDFIAGFENYLKRWDTKKFSRGSLREFLAQVRPDQLSGNILLWAEQGLGDEVFYTGMLKLIQPLSSTITLASDKRLHPIFKRSLPGVDLIDIDNVSRKTLTTHFDVQVPLGDLGYLLRLDKERIKASRKPFLTPDRHKVSMLKLLQPFTQGKIVCGLAWRSANKEFGRAKSVELALLTSLINDDRFNFVNLQYGDVDIDIQKSEVLNKKMIHRVGNLDLFNDLDGLLALIEACNYVVTTSNVTAHLAGAIGKPGCILVPFSSGRLWYWHLQDKYSLWYPTLRVFYQSDPNDWSQTIKQAAKWMHEIY